MADTETITAARRALGEGLAQLRAAAGLSQPQLAPLIGYSRSTIATAETGQRTAARDFWQRCDAVLAAGGMLTRQYDELDVLRRQRRVDLQRATDAERQARVMHRQLAALSIETTPVPNGELEPVTAALDKPWRMGSSTLDATASVLAATRLLEDETSSGAVLQVIRNLVAIADVYAQDARLELRPRMLALTSELHTYLGWLWFAGLRDGQRATVEFDAALALALEADHPDHLAHASSFKAYIALKSQRYDSATALSEAACRDDRTLPALRVFDSYQAGHAYALAGHVRCAERAMLTALTLIS